MNKTLQQKIKNLNWVGGLVPVAGTVAAVLLDHVASANLPKSQESNVRIALWLIVGVAGWLTRKYKLSSDTDIENAIHQIPDDAIDDAIKALCGRKENSMVELSDSTVPENPETLTKNDG